MLENLDLSIYKNVFCDSKKALIWAYKNGLNKDSLIRSSSPAVLWKKNPNVIHIEDRWNKKDFKEFQSTIKKNSEDIYNATINIDRTTREDALAVSLSFVEFHKIIYKAACLFEDDLIKPRLFLKVDGIGGPNGNHMNAPWDLLLKGNNNFNSINYTLQENSWSVSDVDGVPLNLRMRIAGVETVLYRLAIRLSEKLPRWMRKKQLLVHNENELLIEIASNLALKGVAIKKLELTNNRGTNEYKNIPIIQICESIKPIVHNRLKEWLVPGLVDICEKLFIDQVSKALYSVNQLKANWKNILDRENKSINVLITGAPGNLTGFALTGACHEIGIPVVSVQHGVTVEICSSIGEVSSAYDMNTSDYCFTYNRMSEKIEKNSFFSRGKSLVIGMSKRHFRMKRIKDTINSSCPPIVYISTNLYKGNLGYFVGWLTDYDRSLNERNLITSVFSRLPHKIRYKTYPEDNRRYVDKDPAIECAYQYKNIELFEKKIDMRFLLQQHQIVVTSSATSTIGWPVMANKPTVFINWDTHDSLSEEAYISFSNGLFLFDANSEYFHENLREFLSKPISEIVELWDKKEVARKDMIQRFFSEYSSGAGKRGQKLITAEYFS